MPGPYRTPLRSRKSIIQWLESACPHRGGHDYGNRTWLLCFDCKLHGLDLDFTRLLKLHRDACAGNIATIERLNDPVWIRGCREVYYGIGAARLSEWTIETVQTEYVEKRNGVAMYNGDTVTPLFSFMGRSNGWMVLMEFNGFSMEALDCYFDNLPPLVLRQLYTYIVQLKHDLARPCLLVEQQAAYDLFENCCVDVETSCSLAAEAQLKLFEAAGMIHGMTRQLTRRLDRGIRHGRSKPTVTPRMITRLPGKR